VVGASVIGAPPTSADHAPARLTSSTRHQVRKATSPTIGASSRSPRGRGFGEADVMSPAPEPSSGCRNRRRAGLWEGMPGRARKARSREEVGVDHPNRGRPPEVAEGSRRPGARHGDAENAAVRVTAAAAGRLVVRLGGPAIYAGPMVSQGVRCREAESPDPEHCGQWRSRGTAAPGFVHGTEGYPGTARTQPEPTTRGSTRHLAPASPALVF